jgi:hypothetical protein
VETSSYRAKLEAEMIEELRDWLDTIEDRYGPTFALDAFGFIGAVAFTPDGEEPDEGESYASTSVGYRLSDSRQWAQVGILRQALAVAESDSD